MTFEELEDHAMQYFSIRFLRLDKFFEQYIYIHFKNTYSYQLFVKYWVENFYGQIWRNWRREDILLNLDLSSRTPWL